VRPRSGSSAAAKRRRPAAPDGAPRQAGFTLIELSMVVLIIAIIASFGVPYLRSVTGVQLTASTRRLANVTRYLYAEAAFRGEVLVLNVDLDRQGWWIGELDPDTGELREDAGVLSKPVLLPEGVRLVDVALPGAGTITQGTVPVLFYPEGWADPAVFHLADDRGTAYTVRVDPLRGRGEVYDGYQDFSAG
jgi:type II secretion system protein H